MDLTATKSSTPTTTPTTTTPETDTETPPTKSTDHLHQFHRPSSSKLISFTNGALKHHHHHPHHSHQLIIRNPTVVVVVYKECLKNHAASLGGHALDGCGEFMPSPSANSTDPTSLKCAACGCHRNFHRRDPDDHQGTQIVEHHRHTTSSSPRDQSPSPNSVSPPPISSSYFPSSAPHMLLALSAGVLGPPDHHHHHPSQVNNTTTATTTTVMTCTATPTKSIPPVMSISLNGGRKRFRTKFTQEQKERMHSFSEKVGWKMQKRDESLVEEFCNEIGVGRGVLKVWMHNNKHSFGKSTATSTTTTTTTTTRDHHHPLDLHHDISGNSPNNNHHHTNLHKHGSSTTSHDHDVTNGGGGSSSS